MTWAEANHIARIALGTRKERGRGARTIWIADDDPLACWCLTELIHEGVPQTRKSPPTR